MIVPHIETVASRQISVGSQSAQPLIAERLLCGAQKASTGTVKRPHPVGIGTLPECLPIRPVAGICIVGIQALKRGNGIVRIVPKRHRLRGICGTVGYCLQEVLISEPNPHDDIARKRTAVRFGPPRDLVLYLGAKSVGGTDGVGARRVAEVVRGLRPFVYGTAHAPVNRQHYVVQIAARVGEIELHEIGVFVAGFDGGRQNQQVLRPVVIFFLDDDFGVVRR